LAPSGKTGRGFLFYRLVGAEVMRLKFLWEGAGLS
jgi:hypothetical protein